MTHPDLAVGRVAVVTGAASGIGIAAAKRFTSLGMKVCLVNIGSGEIARGSESVESNSQLRDRIRDRIRPQ